MNLRCGFLLLLLGFTGGSSAQTHQEYVWKASHGSATVFLMGSFHALRPTDWPLARTFDDAYAAASEVVIESVATDEEVELFLAENAYYPAGQKISQFIKRTTYVQLQNYLKSRSQPITAFDQLRPWTAIVAIGQIEIGRAGFDVGLGVDLHYRTAADRDDKRVSGLETAEEQLAPLASFTLAEQEAELIRTLTDVGNSKADLIELIEGWKAGDTATRICDHDMDPEFHKRIVEDRNRNWIPKIQSLLEQPNKTTLVIAGACHMVGSNSVVRLLREAGYSVVQQPVIPTTVLASRNATRQRSLKMNVVLGHNYVLERSEDLKSWSPIRTWVSLTTVTNFIDGALTNAVPGFYRARVLD